MSQKTIKTVKGISKEEITKYLQHDQVSQKYPITSLQQSFSKFKTFSSLGFHTTHSGIGIEFLENKDFGIFLHFMMISFIMWYRYHMLISPISIS